MFQFYIILISILEVLTRPFQWINSNLIRCVYEIKREHAIHLA